MVQEIIMLYITYWVKQESCSKVQQAYVCLKSNWTNIEYPAQ